MASASIKNLERLTAKLNKIANMDLKERVTDATTLVHGQAVNNANFKKGYQTGQLRGSIHMKVKKTSDGYQGIVYTNNDHAMFVEFGTGIRGNGSYKYKIKNVNLRYREDWAGMKAQPYMYPALKSQEKNVKTILKYGVRKELEKVCKGG